MLQCGVKLKNKSKHLIQIYAQNTIFKGYANVKLAISTALPDGIYFSLAVKVDSKLA